MKVWKVFTKEYKQRVRQDEMLKSNKSAFLLKSDAFAIDYTIERLKESGFKSNYRITE